MIEKIKKIISQQLSLPVSKITPESKLVEDLGADSLDVVELLMTLEEEFGITVSDEQASKMLTIQDIEDVISQIKK